jgi:hypothetical protein
MLDPFPSLLPLQIYSTLTMDFTADKAEMHATFDHQPLC